MGSPKYVKIRNEVGMTAYTECFKLDYGTDVCFQHALKFVEGDPGYYARLGFRPADTLGFRKPSLRIPDAAFQVMTLTANEPWMTGTLVYAATFWDLDCVGLRDDETHSAARA